MRDMMNMGMQEDGVRVTTRSMALRERGDELGEESSKYRDAVVNVLRKKQKFMRVGEIASSALRNGLLTDPMALVEDYVGRVVAFDIALGGEGLIKRSPDGGYGLKEWVDDAEDSQSTIPDNEMEQSDSVGVKHRAERPLDTPMYSAFEGHPWQHVPDNSRWFAI